MRILVIGGTYFLGKAFVEEVCKENEVFLINRGSRQVSFSYNRNVHQIKLNRHEMKKAMDDESISKELLGIDYSSIFDVVVDFCAYESGDIAEIIKGLSGKIKRYLFVSTADVYKRNSKEIHDEESEFETRDFGGDAGKYILGKVALEEELIKVATEHNVLYNLIRPAFIYGADNYAKRESIFFDWVEKSGQILYPSDATGSFQMVYVKDVVKAIKKIISDNGYANKAFNILGDGIISYESFAEALSYAMSQSIEKVEISCDEVNSRQIPLPFPLVKEESERYTSKYMDSLNIDYIPLNEGLKETYRIRLEGQIPKVIDQLFDENKPKAAEEYMLATREKAITSGFKSTELIVLNELIGYYRQTSEKDKLISIIKDSLLLSNEMGIEGTLEYATTTLNVANAFRSLSMLEDAEKYYSITETIYTNEIKAGRLSERDLLVAGFYNNYSLLKQELNDYKAAIIYLNKALEIVTSKKAGFEIAVTYANLANASLLAKEYDKAREYAYTAIRLFKERGLKDPHYCAALSALAQCYYEKEEYEKAAILYEKAMRIVEETIGKNSQYNRLKDNYSDCKNKVGDKMTGLELSKQYYEEFGKKMISESFPEYEKSIAVGLIGEGSECFGFDDGLSTDHDFGPEFCMWVNDETYEKIGEELIKAYSVLPNEFMGYKRNNTLMGQGRRGLFKVSDFYKKYLGTDKFEDIDFTSVPDYSLAVITNGEIFRDKEGLLSGLRNQLIKKGYPERIRMLKIAEAAASFSQCAQYNYLRMLDREDEVTAQIMLLDGMKHVMKLYHYICNAFPPHDKWLYKSTGRLVNGNEITDSIDMITSQFLVRNDKRELTYAIEELGEKLANIMYAEGIISDTDAYLDNHTEELLFKSSIIENSVEELVEKVVRLEFEAFDKVKNEGGRAYCQNDWPTFSVMRKSQYLTWNKEMLIQYYYDFSREYKLGHNLITEKYGRMMESTDENRWEEIKNNFPIISEEKKAVIEQIVGVQMQMMESFATDHPKTAGNARSLHTYEDDIVNTSYETYLRGEISTYSDKMLQLYGQYVVRYVKEGKNIAFDIMSNTAKLYGFSNLIDFENK